MRHAIQLAYDQKVRLNNHLSESTEHTAENFYSLPEEIEVTIHIHGILLANHPSFTG